eukprot:gene25547-34105_t
MGLASSYFSLREFFNDESSLTSSEVKDYYKNLTGQLPLSKKVKGRYISPWSHETEKRFLDALRYGLTRKQEKLKILPDEDGSTHTAIEELQMKVDIDKIKSTEKSHFTWMGHATNYYQTNGIYFLTDPLWSSRASPFQFVGPARYIDPPIAVEDLHIDVVLLSHTHYDHLDEGTARRIGDRALWVVPLGVKKILAGMGVSNVVELDWWESYTYMSKQGSTAEIIFAPTKHWTARTFLDRNQCLWGSFAVLAEKSRFFFAGDTAYCNIFQQIGAKYGPFDIAAIPIGAYSPRWFMKDVHCNPEEAVKIHEDLGAKQSVAIHWGTLPLADEDFVEPALELARVRDMRQLSTHQFFTMAHGETLTVGDSPRFDLATVRSDLYGMYLDSLRKKPVLVER